MYSLCLRMQFLGAKSRRLSLNGNGIVCTYSMECKRFSHAQFKQIPNGLVYSSCFGEIFLFFVLLPPSPSLSTTSYHDCCNFTGNLCETNDLVVWFLFSLLVTHSNCRLVIVLSFSFFHSSLMLDAVFVHVMHLDV